VSPRVARLLDLAAQLTPQEQADFLARECPDPRERAEIAALLQYAAGAESCFDLAVQGVARSLQYGQQPSPGDIVGGYRIVSLLGRGGMGSVYLAEYAHSETPVRVALKLLHCDYHGWRERFQLERHLLASLHHPAIVRALDAGHTEGGRPFLVMEYVEGIPIDRYAAGVAIPERLKLMLRVCDAVSYAHQQRTIHRDLKPSNILVDTAGHPKLLDFGIAKVLDSGDATRTIERLLTPEYASPEQLRGQRQSTATDIYSLAAVLYKVLTGDAPRDDLPTTSAISVDLRAVLRKALRAEPQRRYRSVNEFAADLRAILDSRPVAARADEFYYRLSRSLRPWMPMVSAVLLAASAGLWIVSRQCRRASDLAREWHPQ